MSLFISIAAIMITLGLVIFVHESGHFILCKIVGIRVLKFAFGFGKEIVGITRNSTRYSINWVPLGGYVKPAGEDYFERKDTDAISPAPDEYFGKPWYQRVAVVIAGPFMNYVLAFVIFTVVFWIWGGNPQATNNSVIGSLKPDMPAAQAGLRPGDRIIAIQGAPVATWKEMAEIIHNSPSASLQFTVEREQKSFEITITPQLDQENNIGLIGIYPDVVLQHLGFVESMQGSVIMTWMITVRTLQYFATTIRRMERPKQVAGPIGIFKFISDAAHTGLREFLSLLGLLSVAIGLFNLFPIPLLDGGHVVFYVLEGILRKPLNKTVMAAANYVGIAILLTIFLYASYNDITRLKYEKETSAVTEQKEK